MWHLREFQPSRKHDVCAVLTESTSWKTVLLSCVLWLLSTRENSMTPGWYCVQLIAWWSNQAEYVPHDVEFVIWMSCLYQWARQHERFLSKTCAACFPRHPWTVAIRDFFLKKLRCILITSIYNEHIEQNVFWSIVVVHTRTRFGLASNPVLCVHEPQAWTKLVGNGWGERWQTTGHIRDVTDVLWCVDKSAASHAPLNTNNRQRLCKLADYSRKLFLEILWIYIRDK